MRAAWPMFGLPILSGGESTIALSIGGTNTHARMFVPCPVAVQGPSVVHRRAPRHPVRSHARTLTQRRRAARAPTRPEVRARGTTPLHQTVQWWAEGEGICRICCRPAKCSGANAFVQCSCPAAPEAIAGGCFLWTSRAPKREGAGRALTSVGIHNISVPFLWPITEKGGGGKGRNGKLHIVLWEIGNFEVKLLTTKQALGLLYTVGPGVDHFLSPTTPIPKGRQCVPCISTH